MAGLTDKTREYGEQVTVYTDAMDSAGYIPELRGPLGLKRLAKMAETDDTVGAMMWAVETTMAQVVWSHEAAKDGKPSNDPKAAQAADFANTLLGDMEHSFQEHVDEAMSMLWAGFSICEILPKQRDGQNSKFPDGKWGIDALVARPQTSVSGWGVENGRVTTVKTMTTMGEKEIPLFKCLHYKIKGNSRTRPQGRSLFTNAYRSWYLKNDIQDAEAIGIRRELCGLPVASVPMADINAATKKGSDGKLSPEGEAALARITAFKTAVSKMRLNETSGLVKPSDPFLDEDGKPSMIPQYDFKILSGGGQRSMDPRAPIRDYDRAIARVAMMQFLHLGDRSTGSYALSDNQSTLALRSMRALVGKIIDEWNRKVLPLLWELNGMDKAYMPVLTSSPITEDSLEELGTFLERLSSAQLLLDEEPELKESMLSRIGIRRDRVTKPAGARARLRPAQPPTPEPARAAA
ncbi:portal protein [Caulobacter phage Sansa]|uniref:Portal protein n=1 Tax=Caulobacter phage Sansa TaxID=1675600 RepID=A0A0K1LLQ8_9CAUD|nr:portal protein [Caulobacter phage Sansa]AKU43426.1 portal protein [Caulobacter phage Sansa]